MKKTIICTLLALVALWGAFYTENLTERNRRLELAQLKPDQLVATLMADSMAALGERAVTLRQLAEGCADEAFARQHGHVLGIGSPTFYVVRGECDNAQVRDHEIRLQQDGVELVIPLKYIFGNTARDASGWFNIDDFQNTMDFNAVSAAMNACIVQRLQQFTPAADGRLQFLGAVAVSASHPQAERLTLIPYELK